MGSEGNFGREMEGKNKKKCFKRLKNNLRNGNSQQRHVIEKKAKRAGTTPGSLPVHPWPSLCPPFPSKEACPCTESPLDQSEMISSQKPSLSYVCKDPFPMKVTFIGLTRVGLGHLIGREVKVTIQPSRAAGLQVTKTGFVSFRGKMVKGEVFFFF